MSRAASAVCTAAAAGTHSVILSAARGTVKRTLLRKAGKWWWWDDAQPWPGILQSEWPSGVPASPVSERVPIEMPESRTG